MAYHDDCDEDVIVPNKVRTNRNNGISSLNDELNHIQLKQKIMSGVN